MKKPGFVISCLSLVAGACAASPVDESTATATSGALPVPSLAATVESVSCEGQLCPEGSAVDSLSSNAFTITFSDAIVQGKPQAPTTRSARIAVDVNVPTGYQFSSGRFIARGAVMEGEPSGSVVAISRFHFEGSNGTRFAAHVLPPDEQGFVTVDRPRDLWSPTCGSSHTARLVLDLTVALQAADYFALDSLDGAFTVPEGLEWRRCGETEPIQFPPSQKGAYCGGVSEQPCVAGLACEYRFETEELGTCVDPNEVVPPQPKDESCGGYRNIACQDGLVCRFVSPRSVAEKRLGACTPAIGGEGDSCGGYPTVPCTEGLSCFAAANVCVFADGEFGSRCGEGLTECKEGLTCNGNTCVAPPAKEGEACGGPMEVRCTKPLECQEGFCRK